MLELLLLVCLIILVVLIVSNLSIFYSHAATLELFSFEIRSTNPPLEPLPSLLLATLTALLFVASILAHELAHAAAFRSRGIPVRGITLFMFGGYTQGANEAEKPVDELLIAGVGPLTTTVLGLLFLAMHVAAKGAESGDRVIPKVDLVVLSRTSELLHHEVERGISSQHDVQILVHRVVGWAQSYDGCRWETISRARNEGKRRGAAAWRCSSAG